MKIKKKLFKYISIIIILITFLSCSEGWLPKIKIPLKNIKNIPIYTIFYECTGDIDKTIKVCDGGIYNGNMYCDNPVFFKCKKGDKKIFYSYDYNSRSKLQSYIKYLFESYNKKINDE